jgi:hypothetical protein
MEKALLLKVLKISALVLVFVGFFLPFVLMSVAIPGLVGDHVFSLLNAHELPTKLMKPEGDSSLIYIILFLVVAGVAAANMFVKEEFSRISYLAALVVGLIVLVLAYSKVFNDAELQAAVDSGAITLSLGFGFILQIILLVVGGVLEFLGKKLLKVE